MYTPDWSIVKQLKSYDDRLEVRWLAKKERWGIFRRVPAKNRLYDREVLIHLVQGPGGIYRPLDLRVLWELQRTDHHRRNRNEILREFMESQQRREDQERAKFRDDIGQITKEVRPMLAREADQLLGAANVPKEDLRTPEMTDEEVDTSHRQNRQNVRRRLNRRLKRQGYQVET